jgi:hypothetical protein
MLLPFCTPSPSKKYPETEYSPKHTAFQKLQLWGISGPVTSQEGVSRTTILVLLMGKTKKYNHFSNYEGKSESKVPYFLFGI